LSGIVGNQPNPGPLAALATEEVMTAESRARRKTYVVAKQLVLGVFPNLDAAQLAVKNLQEGGADYLEMHIGSIGILVLDDKGKLKEMKRGQRMGGRGATIGLALAAVTPIGLIAGLAGGAVLGHFRQQGPKFSDDDRERLVERLQGGKAALGMIVEASQADLAAQAIEGHGGSVAESLEMSDEEVEAAQASLPESDAEG
jgi:uncharacterized membrane protein